MGLLDLLFPKYCVVCKKIGDYICGSCFAKLSFDVATICTVCNKNSIDGLTHQYCKTRYTLDGAFSSISYNKIAKKMLYVFKYKPYVSRLKEILVDLLYEGIIQKEVLFKILQKKPMLVPIPLHPSKLKKRGYNQSELLAQGLGQKLELICSDVLIRQNNTKSQYGLKRDERIENMKGAFSLKEKYLVTGRLASPGAAVSKIVSSQAPRNDVKTIQGSAIILIDDVLTTGTTLSEAGRVLKKAGAKEVYGITLAHGT